MFHYTDALRALLIDIISHVDIFHHVDLIRVGVSFTLTRSRKQSGVLAKVVPLRFENGERQGTQGDKHYVMPPLVHQGQELLYLYVVYLPRFQDLDTEQKLRTLFHELYHIAPAFNGDIRRFPGANYAHGRSRKWFDEQFESELQHFIQHHFDAAHHHFLSWSFDTLDAK